jgi:hypothetical protein
VLWPDESFDRLLVCGSTCELFAAEGVLRIVYGSPPCE